MERDDLALDGLLRELARAPEGDEAFVRGVLARAERPVSRRALFFVAAAGVLAALGFLFEPAPSARLGLARQACLVPEAKAMRVFTVDEGRRLLLGEVPLDSQVRVPAGLPILLQALGDDGMALWTDPDVYRLRPREVRAPSTGPVVALSRKLARPVDYGQDVKPILDQHCVGCHAEGELLAAAKPFDARHSALVAGAHVPIPASERRRLALWIDLGAARP
jgi:hypothetical protein